MKIYQINIIGESDVVSDTFKAHSKKVYKHMPTKDEINEFVQNCSTGGFINLNPDKPYNVVITELEVIK